MPELFLQAKDITIGFGGKPLLENVQFNLHEGDRVCLVGRNGSGKTTLFGLITGRLEPDNGLMWRKPGMRIGYLPQQVPYKTDKTVYDFVLEGIEYEDGITPDMMRYRADIVLAPLGLTGNETMGNLSGGQVRRAALAQALISEPHILLLDEPTNHLDIAAIEWLEQFLRDYKGSVLCISHDRAFLGNISTKTFWLDRHRIRTNDNGYKDFERWSTLLIEQEARELEKLGKLLEQENQWLQTGVTARRKRNMRRLGELYRLREKIKTQKSMYQRALNTVELPSLSPQESAKLIIDMEGVNKSFDGEKILDNVYLRIMRGDKIGIIGANGSGKTTLLRIITNDLAPDSGRTRRGMTETKFRDSISYFDQRRDQLNPTKTVWETLCPSGGDHVKVGEEMRHVVSYLKDFLFDPKQARLPVGALSGGEANRLLLAKILANPASILILDEPTNDLDMDTLDMLQELLSEYQGTLLLVSHDRDFIDRIVTRTIVFEARGDMQQYVGGYTDYLAQRQSAKNATKTKKTTEREKSTPAPTEASSTTSSTPKKKLSFKQQHILATHPDKIAATETDIADLELQLSESGLYTRDAALFTSLTQALEQKKQDKHRMEEEWLEVAMLQGE